MCLLTFFPAGQLPDIDALFAGAWTNNDGHGYAIVAGDELIVGHGMEAFSVIEEFAKLRMKYPHGPALFHSRFTTHGETGVDNCHPFYLGDDMRTVIAHNGVLPQIVQPGKGDKRSDTRIAAEDFIPRVIGPLSRKKNRRRLERWMGPWNKIVVLSVNPRYQSSAYILNERSGIWEDGIWYSNSGYIWTPAPSIMRRPYSCGYPKDEDSPETKEYKRWWEEGVATCGACGAVVNIDDDYCCACLTCLDCGQDMEESCQCYTPMVLGPTKVSGESAGLGWPGVGD